MKNRDFIDKEVIVLYNSLSLDCFLSVCSIMTKLLVDNFYDMQFYRKKIESLDLSNTVVFVCGNIFSKHSSEVFHKILNECYNLYYYDYHSYALNEMDIHDLDPALKRSASIQAYMDIHECEYEECPRILLQIDKYILHRKEIV